MFQALETQDSQNDDKIGQRFKMHLYLISVKHFCTDNHSVKSSPTVPRYFVYTAMVLQEAACSLPAAIWLTR
jgi:hypothetical protein